MYLNRLIDKELKAWATSPVHKPILLRGARQVGKSSSVRHLGELFDHYIEVNFEKRPELKLLFAEVHDVRELAARLGQIYGKPIVTGKTLLFIDEIQACEDALKTLWFFKEDFPDLHVIAAGSLLEFTLKNLHTYGVGRIRSIFMYPLSFDEFLLATEHPTWIDAKNEASASRPLPEVLHHDLVQAYRSYIMVGGMPASVVAWVQTHDYNLCAAEQDDIQQSYYDDFSKYAAKIDPLLLRNTLQSAIMQAGRKFMFSKVAGDNKSSAVKMALSLLCDAGLLRPVRCSAANGLPLGAEVNDKFTKYIFLDSGLLLRILDLQLGGARELTQTILAGTAEDLVNKGSLAEMITGWELIKYSSCYTQHDLYYWENTDNGATSEVDYVISKNLKPLPIEVKSGTNGKMKSLFVYMNKKGFSSAIRSSLENFGHIEHQGDKDLLSIDIVPLYAMSCVVNAMPT